MNSLSRTDLSLLLSLGALPLVACQLDVGDGLTAGGTSIPSVGSGAGTDDGGTGDTGDGAPGTASNDHDDDGGGDTGVADTGAGPTSVTGADPTAASADGGQVDDSGGVDSDGGDGGPGGGYGDSEACQQFGAHATECGLDEYAAGYCDEDISVGMFLGAGCQSAMQDYYSCLSTTDCASLGAGDPCGRDQVGAACGGITPQV